MSLPIPTPTELTDLQSLFQNNIVENLGGLTTGDTVYNFLDDLTIINWTNMQVGIQDFLSTYSGQFPGLRVQISKSDGNLAYDSQSLNNSYENALSNGIGSNINTLSCVNYALQNGDTYEYQNQYSNQFGKYVVAYTAKREGPSRVDPYGCSLVSYQAINYS